MLGTGHWSGVYYSNWVLRLCEKPKKRACDLVLADFSKKILSSFA